MRKAVRGALAIAAAVVLSACSSGSGDVARGAGLEPASLTAVQQAAVYAATASGSFDIGPSLILLVDSTMLPRDAGYGDGGTLPDDVLKAMLGTEVFQGTCKPIPARAPARAPSCPVTDAGYAVRVSPIFDAAGDTLLVYEAADRYDTRRSGGHERFLMEEAYKVVPRGKSWRVVSKARVHAP
jgi:hypothetical protein